jgi:hypothetical protein
MFWGVGRKGRGSLWFLVVENRFLYKCSQKSLLRSSTDKKSRITNW